MSFRSASPAHAADATTLPTHLDVPAGECLLTIDATAETRTTETRKVRFSVR